MTLAGRFSDAALSLLESKPEVILATSTAAVQAVRTSDQSTPAVFTTAFDPIRAGLANSIARPDLRTTGVQGSIETLPSKQLELAREILPQAASFAILSNSGNASAVAQRIAFERAAPALSLTPFGIDIAAGGIPKALREAASSNVSFCVLPTDAALFAQREVVVRLALDLSLAIVAPRREFAEVGALFSYGLDLLANYVRAAELTARILAGVDVSDIPIELPPRLELSINLNTARLLNVLVPATVAVQADNLFD